MIRGCICFSGGYSRFLVAGYFLSVVVGCFLCLSLFVFGAVSRLLSVYSLCTFRLP